MSACHSSPSFSDAGAASPYLPDRISPYDPAAEQEATEIAQIREFDDLQDDMKALWSGVGAVPGANILPMKYSKGTSACGCKMSTCDGAASSAFQYHRPIDTMASSCMPLVMPGLAAGPHAFDADEGQGVPVNCTPYSMPYMLPDREVYTDPMDNRMWNPATSGTEDATDPALVWGRPCGIW